MQPSQLMAPGSMIGLDTNVGVRYIAQNDPDQSPKANALMESLTPEEPGYVALVSLVEVVWVLAGCYEAKKEAIVNMLETLLRTQEVRVEQAETVWKALRAWKVSQADFADCLIERVCHVA